MESCGHEGASDVGGCPVRAIADYVVVLKGEMQIGMAALRNKGDLPTWLDSKGDAGLEQHTRVLEGQVCEEEVASENAQSDLVGNHGRPPGHVHAFRTCEGTRSLFGRVRLGNRCLNHGGKNVASPVAVVLVE